MLVGIGLLGSKRLHIRNGLCEVNSRKPWTNVMSCVLMGMTCSFLSLVIFSDIVQERDARSIHSNRVLMISNGRCPPLYRHSRIANLVSGLKRSAWTSLNSVASSISLSTRLSTFSTFCRGTDEIGFCVNLKRMDLLRFAGSSSCLIAIAKAACRYERKRLEAVAAPRAFPFKIFYLSWP